MSEEAKNSDSRYQLILLLLSTGTLFFVLFLRFSHETIWLDEAYSIYVASDNPAEIISHLKNDNGPPLYYFLLAFWVRAFGIKEFAVRSMSLIFFVASLPAIYLLAKSIFNKETGLYCVVLYMLSQQSTAHALNVRMYSLLALIGILSTLFFLRMFFLEIDSRTDQVLYVAVNIMGTFTHYWFMFIILSHIVCHMLLFSRQSFRKLAATAVLSLIPFLFLWLPVLLVQMNNGSTAWLSAPDVFTTLIKTAHYFYGDKFYKGATSLPLYFTIVMAVLFTVKGSKIEYQNLSILKALFSQRINKALLILLCVPIAVPLLISQFVPIYCVGRYTIIALCPFVLLAGTLLYAVKNRVILSICFAVLIVTTSSNAMIYADKEEEKSDKRTAEFLVQNAHNKDVIIFTSLSRLAVDYYLRAMEFSDSATKITFPYENSLHMGWREIDKTLRQKDSLEKEADAIVNSINNDTTGINEIWLLYGTDTEISRILKDKLDVNFSLKSKLHMKGYFHDMVLVYQNTAGER